MNINAFSYEVSGRLKEIFKERFGINFNNYNDELLKEELLGEKIGLNGRDLLYLYFDIEKEFGFKIAQEDIASGKFSSFNQIAEMISKEQEKRKVLVV